MSQTQQPKPGGMNFSRFSESDEEASDRYRIHKAVDPFSDVPSAFLNSADISDYVAETGLIFPFDDHDENLKAAAYRVRILGEIVYWEVGGVKKSSVLGENDEFILPANSITFITLEPVFRIPDYIKVWFTLDASHVYKGLLLNSGFIDPGFVGRLVLPLHNPTANQYPLRGRDSLIWITLMKISPLPQWTQRVLFKTVRTGKFREFPDRKKNPKIEDHLTEAVGFGGSIRTASAVILEGARHSATSAALPPQNDVVARRQAQVDEENQRVKANDRWRFGMLVAVATLAFTVIAAMGGMLALQIQTNSYTQKLGEEFLALQQRQSLQDRSSNSPTAPQISQGDQSEKRQLPRRNRRKQLHRRLKTVIVDSSTDTTTKPDTK
jgi:deoxycytidine triphosphate deaminase